jgi:hypothetical protein
LGLGPFSLQLCRQLLTLSLVPLLLPLFMLL